LLYNDHTQTAEFEIGGDLGAKSIQMCSRAGFRMVNGWIGAGLFESGRHEVNPGSAS
jgi:hypothetical protein